MDRDEGTGGLSLLLFTSDGCQREEMRRGGDGATTTFDGADLFLSPKVGTGGLAGGGAMMLEGKRSERDGWCRPKSRSEYTT